MFKRNHLTKTTWFVLLLISLTALLACSVYAAKYQLILDDKKADQLQAQSDIAPSHFPRSSRSRAVKLTPAIAKSEALVPGDDLILNLFSDAVYRAKIDKVTKNKTGTRTVRGRIENYPYAYTIITTTGNRTLAKIEIPENNRKYTIQSDISGKHYLLDQTHVVRDELEGGACLEPPIDISAQGIPEYNQVLASPTDPATIDVLIVYTPAARSWADTSGGGIDNVIAQALATGQTVCDNSNVFATLRLVHSAEVSYTENGDSGVDLDRLKNTSDGFMDIVHEWRDYYGADIVTLVASVDDVGGLSYVLGNPAGSPQWAFSLSRVQQSAGGYTLVHEQGHTMGCGHHKDQNFQPGPGIFSYSAGGRWVDSNNNRYCSVMTYESGEYFADNLSHSRVAHWSNPNVTYYGSPTGDAVDADNARTIRETKHVVAAYRATVNMPTISISNPSVSVTKSGPVSYTVTYENVSSISLKASDITLTKTGTANGTVSVTGYGTTSRTVVISNTTGTGTIKISIAANTATDGNDHYAPAAGPSVAFTVDNTPPTVLMGAPSVPATNSGPVTYNVVYGGASNITLSTANITLTKTGTANGTVSVSGSGTSLRVITISNTTGDGTLRLSISAGTAVDSAGNTAPAAGPSVALTVDNIAPSVSIGEPTDSLTKNGPVDYTITYIDIDAGDITLTSDNVTLNKTGTANGTIAVSGTESNSRKVTISNISGDGTLGISLSAGTAHDTAGNNVPAAGPSTTFVVDNTGPTVNVVQTKTQADPTNQSPIYFLAQFNEPVIGFSSNDVTVSGTAGGTKSVEVTGSGTSYTMAVSGMTTSGTVIVTLAAGVVLDELGNTNSASTGSNNIVTYDVTPPTLTISAPSATVTSGGPVSFLITYRGATDITLSAADIIINKKGSAAGNVKVEGTGTSTRTVTIMNLTGDGSIGISIASGTAADSVGNLAAAAGPSATFSVDNTPPAINISAPSAASTSTGPVSYTVTYTGASAITLAKENITLNKTGSADGTVDVVEKSSTERTVTISGITGEGTLGISIASGTASDTAGNIANAAGPSTTFSVIKGYIISSTVNLGDFLGSIESIPVKVDLLSTDYQILRTETVMLDSSGVFRIHNVAPGTYYVGIKPSHWLRKVTGPVDVVNDDVVFTIQ